MAKRKKETEIEVDVFADLAGATGGQVLREAGQVPYYVDTGNLAFNFECSGKFITGGFPGGRIIEALGPEASGKSLIGHCFLGNIQRMKGIGILLDCERSAGAEFAERCGHVDVDKLLVYEPVTLEQVEKKIITVVNAIRKKFPEVPIGIVWDSIGVCPSEREWNETGLPENPTKEQIKAAGGNERPGERAKAANAALRKLNPFLNENNATMYVINQIRKKIGVMFGDPEIGSGGGEALKYYASLRFRCNAPKVFREKTTKLPLGVNMSISNRKNRHTTPGIKIEGIPLFFSGGIDPLGGLVDALLLAKRITGSGSYTIKPEFTGGEEDVKFSQSKTKPFDVNVLLKYPALIDAKDADEITAYLKEWSEASALAMDAGVEQVEANADEVEHLVGKEEE